MLLQVLWRYRNTLSVDIRGRSHQNRLSRGGDLAGDDIAVECPIGWHQRDVVVLNRWFFVRGNLHFQKDIRVQLAKTGDQGRDHMGSQHRRSQQPQNPSQRLCLSTNRLISFFNVTQNRPDPSRVDLASRTEREATRASMQQTRAEVTLQVSHQPRDHRRRDIQAARCGRKTTLVHHLKENPH